MLNQKNYDRLIAAANEKTKEREYWLNKLNAEIEKNGFPFDYAKDRDHQCIMQTSRFTITGEPYAKLMKLSNNIHQALFLVLVAGLTALIEKYTGANDITLGTPILKQNIKKELINKVLVMRNRSHPQMTFKELLMQVKQTFIEAVEHRNYPLELLANQLGMSTTAGDFPLFGTAVLLENIHDENDIAHINTDLLFAFQEESKAVHCRVNYDSTLYRLQTIERIGIHFINLLEKAFSMPDSPFLDLDILEDEEKELLLDKLNDTRTPFPKEKTIHQLFREQVEKTPHSLAVVYEDQKITYGELNKRAHRLYALLEKKGIGPNHIVGLMIPRSLEMIIAIMGILKTGAAYLPIIPETPPDRVTAMLEDCNSPLLITRSDIVRHHTYTALQNLRPMQTLTEPHLTPTRPQVKNLDSLPMPDRSLVNYEKYSRYIGQTMAKNTITMQATRGCPYNCAYCHKIWPKSHVYRSAEHIFAEVQHYYNMGVRRFAFIDDVFNLNIKNSKRFFQLIIDHGLQIQIFFPAGLRGDILTPDYIDLMIEAGTVSFALALETASPRLQKLMGKNLNIKKLQENIDYICENHPRVILELFIMTGFPTETKEEALDTLEFLKNVKWVHFPYLSILRIYPNTDMERLALQNGVSKETITESANLAYHEVPTTLPFEKSFMSKYQSQFLNDYFLSEERLLKVLPHQMKVLTEDELVQKYNSYLPVDIHNFSQLLDVLNISRDQLGDTHCLDEAQMYSPHLHQKMKRGFPAKTVEPNALRVLLLDLSQFFSAESNMLFDVVEPPLGLMSVMTYLKEKLGGGVNGKIAKSRVDFDNYPELKTLLEEFKPHVIGLRTLTFFKEFYHKCIAMIRQWGFDGPLIAGGPYATSSYDSILQDRNIDLVVRGEGEITFYELIEKIIESGGKLPPEKVLARIPGVAFLPRTHKERRTAREIVLMDGLDLSASAIPPAAGKPAEPVHPHSSALPAYIIFTSGSTGKPKGTCTTHYNVTRVVKNTNYINIVPHDRLLQLSNYAFDGSVFDIYGALLNGAPLVMMDKEHVFAPDKLSQLIKKENISVFFLTTALFNTLVDLNIECLRDIRKVLFGGENVSLKHAAKALDYCGKNKIIHMYGPTETTVYATYYPLDAIEERQTTIPIGKPLANTSVYILDKNFRPVPLGGCGEIYIGGDGVAMGYLNNPELTAQKFISAPIDAAPPSLLYRSGDLARMDPHGNIEFIGRVDQQVKIRGYRIEPGEIEAALEKHPAIEKTVVLPIERKDGGGKNLCAYILPRRGCPPTEDIRGFLARSLPDFMIPQYIVNIESIPMTPSGKIDRKKLPPPETKTNIDFVTPRSNTEKKLAAIWNDVLEIERALGIDDNFFEIGGHSLNATVLASKIHKQMNVKLPLTEVFSKQTIREMASCIDKARENKYEKIEPVEEKEYYPLSSAQKRLYFLQQVAPHSTAYNVPLVMPLGKHIDKEKLETALEKLAAKHESLRTSIIEINEVAMQKIHRTAHFQIESRTANGIAEAETIINNFIRPFDLSRAPLLRSCLIRIPDKAPQADTYTWVVDMHHIITDGTSMNVLVHDFTALFTNPSPNQDKPATRYRDYSVWQTQLLESEEIKKQEHYWQNLFNGEIPILDMPADYKRPEVFTFAGDVIQFQLEGNDAQAFKAMATQNGGTLYMNILALLNTLFFKYTGQTDIIIGCETAGRPHADLQRTIGMFVNTLAMRNYPEGEETYQTFLRRVIQNTVQAFENQDLPFEELVDKLQINRDASRNPLFDISMLIQNMFSPTEGKKQTEAPSSSQRLSTETSPSSPSPLTRKHNVSAFDMTFNVLEEETNIQIKIEYYTAIFKKETIQRLATHFVNIVKTVLKNPLVKLKDIEIMSGEEREMILYRINDTEAGFPEEKTIHRLFSEQVNRTPDRIAVTGDSLAAASASPSNRQVALSYRQLRALSLRAAHALNTKGVTADTIVAVMTERTVEMIAALLGILEAGGAYLPIEPGLPADRVSYILSDSAAPVLVTTKNTGFPRMEAIDLQDLIHPGNEVPQIHSRADRLTPANSRNLAYIIYTSGTTGRPKGVMIEHRNVVRLFFNDRFQFHFNSTDIWTMFHSYSFDFSVWEMYGALLFGGQLVIVSPAVCKDTAAFLELLKSRAVTVLNQTPSAFYILTEEELNAPDHCLRLKYVIFGGEALAPVKLKNWQNKYPRTMLINMFGITETTVHVTYKPIGEVEIAEGASNIGRPIPTLSTYVMDRDHKLLPIGIPGECCVAGEGVARGYLNRPTLTRDKFIHNPHKPGERLYLSGDRVKFRYNGELEYLGRIDHQVKIRGYRIELGEIENKLLEHPRVCEAVVLAIGDLYQDRYLCAYIVTFGNNAFHDNAALTTELSQYLLQFLPAYMIPAYFQTLESIPLTANNKVDRKKLPKPDFTAAADAFLPPVGEVEHILAEIWSDVLGIEKEKISADADFFELGGHSLKATSLISKIHKKMEIKIPLVEIFKRPTLGTLAAYIKDADAGQYRPYQSLQPAEKKEYYPLSSAQKRLFVLYRMAPQSTVYNLPEVIPLDKNTDVEKLEQTFGQLIQRHENLRTSFHLLDNEPVQAVHDKVDFELDFLQVDTGTGSLEGNSIQHIADLFVRPFDLSQAPLIRAKLVRTNENDLLLVDMHHILSDAVSHQILVEDFSALYRGEELPQLKLQYKDYSQWQNKMSRSPHLKRQETYWLERFSGKIPRLKLPTDYPRPSEVTFEGENTGFDIDHTMTRRIRDFAAKEGVTLYMFMLAVYYILLARYSNQEDIIVGSPTAGRTHEDLNDIIGIFVNMLPMRNFPKGNKIFNQYLQEVKQNTIDAFENQDYQFENLVENLGIVTGGSRHALIDTVFVLQDSRESPPDAPGGEPQIKNETGPAAGQIIRKESKFDLKLAIFAGHNHIRLNYEYRSQLFKQQTIRRMNEHFIQVLETVIQEPRIQIARISLAAPDEFSTRQKTGSKNQTMNLESNRMTKKSTLNEGAFEF